MRATVTECYQEKTVLLLLHLFRPFNVSRRGRHVVGIDEIKVHRKGLANAALMAYDMNVANDPECTGPSHVCSRRHNARTGT